MIRHARASLLAALVLLLILPVAASGHEERESTFPDYDAATRAPAYRTQAEAADVLVVCKEDSGSRIAAMTDATRKAQAESLLDDCAFEHIQAAVDAVTVQGTNIYVLPGLYREEPSIDAPCTADYDDGVVEYELIVSCGEVINLITVAGDDPADEDIACDNQLCNLQIEGLGDEPQDTKVLGGFDDEGDWVKHNGIKADRADGFALINMAFELFRENAIYVHETSGYLLDQVEANFNDLYGILTFTSDRGIISNCETHHNGDSGVYPGSAADVNGEVDPVSRRSVVPTDPPISRWSVEIFGCDTHHNALGFSGTAGNSVYFHDNLVHHNGAGYVTDSFVGGHPGMPQDHARLENNRIYANNENYYVNVQGDDAPCQRPRPVDRGHQDGVVCPAFPVPVGTGVLIAGGNSNLLASNLIYDNWRNGVMQFYVPAALRFEREITQSCNPDNVEGCFAYDFEGGLDGLAGEIMSENDTSHDNYYIGNTFGLHPDGFVQPNGTDVWWDDQGLGNCWQDNTTSAGDELSNNATAGLPTCDVGSMNPAANATKSGVLIPCAQYHRSNNPDPEGCDWFETQAAPEGREDDGAFVDDGLGDVTAQAAQGDDTGGALAATGGGSLLALIGVAAVAGSTRLRRRRDDEAGTEA